MRRLLTLSATAAAFTLLIPSQSRAVCNAIGTVPRVFITSAVTNIGVRSNTPGSTFFNFQTTDDTFIQAAVVAEANHLTVSVVGNAPSCGLPVGGLSAGGTVVQILVSP